MSFRIFKAGKYSFNLDEKSRVMGILNVTPDSFSDGGVYSEPEKAIERAFEIENLGADIIDIGAQSTRPGFSKISSGEEWKRLYPVLKEINGRLNVPVSIDTFYPEVAEKALKLGADIINDVSGFKNPKMFEIVSKSNCGIIIMYSGNFEGIKQFFESKISEAENYGISRERICIDPGIGFLSTRAEDRFAINNLGKLCSFGVAVLVGISRKRVISEYCGDKSNYSRLFGTTAANTIAIERGANIIRVHDVREGVISAKTADAILKTKEIL